MLDVAPIVDAEPEPEDMQLEDRLKSQLTVMNRLLEEFFDEARLTR